jgi:hypothetical protein
MLSKNAFRRLVKQCLAEVITEELGNADSRITPAERKQIGKSFAAAGLDGNGHFQKKEHGLQAITKVLDSLGFQLDMVSADIIMGDEGSRNLSFRRKNDAGADPFTEKEAIANSRIVFSWYNRAPQGQIGQSDFEILSYAS